MEIVTHLLQILHSLWSIFLIVTTFALEWSLLLAWMAWWVFCADWKQIWPTLRIGGWAPLLLSTLMAALVWSRFDPNGCYFFNIIIPTYLCKLLATSAVVLLTLACGGIQTAFEITPPEVSFDTPSAHSHGHSHGGHGDHSHGHGDHSHGHGDHGHGHGH